MNEKIIDLIKSDPENGMKILDDEYGSMISYIIQGLLPEERDREECKNDIYVKIWNHINLYDYNKSKFNTWISTISRNTAISYLRKNKKINIIEYYDDKEIADLFLEYNNSPEEIFFAKENSKELEKVLDFLKKQEREIFLRKYYYLQSVRQIAAEMVMTEKMVEGRLYRIKKKLRYLMGGNANDKQ